MLGRDIDPQPAIYRAFFEAADAIDEMRQRRSALDLALSIQVTNQNDMA